MRKVDLLSGAQRGCNNTMLARLYSYCAVGFYAEVEGQQIDKMDKAVCQYDTIFYFLLFRGCTV